MAAPCSHNAVEVDRMTLDDSQRIVVTCLWCNRRFESFSEWLERDRFSIPPPPAGRSSLGSRGPPNFSSKSFDLAMPEDAEEPT
jgi:hypothetical protein